MSSNSKPTWIYLIAINWFVFLALQQCRVGAEDQKPAADKKTLNDKVKEIAGTAEFLRSVPKHFATLKGVDAAQLRVTLLIEGESLPKVWPLVPDAEIKRAGWWARLDQLRANDRVWVWFETDRHKQPRAVSMICDELSEQEIHGGGVTPAPGTTHDLTLKPSVGKSRTVHADMAAVFRGSTQITTKE